MFLGQIYLSVVERSVRGFSHEILKCSVSGKDGVFEEDFLRPVKPNETLLELRAGPAFL